MKDFKTCMKGLWRMARPVLGRDLVTVLIGGVRIAASLSFVWICKRLVDIATGVSSADLKTHIFIMIGIIVVQILTGLLANYWGSYNTIKTRNQLRLGMFSHVLNSRWNGRETFRSGDTINRLEEDIRVLTDLICGSFPDVIITVIQLIAASVYLLTLAPSLLWVLIILMAAAVIGSKMYFGKIRKLTSDIRSLDSEVQQLEQENLQNRVLVLTLFGVGNVVSRLDGLQNRVKKLTITRLNYNAVARGFMSFGFMGGYTAAFIWGILGIKSGAVTYGMMTAFLQLVSQVQRPIASLGSQVPAFIKALTSVERILELEDLKVEKYHGDVLYDGAPGIIVSDVSFAYSKPNTDTTPGPAEERLILNHFSHDFKPGTLTVLAGPTGVGKSTLTRLMLGLLKPNSGSVSLYGKGRNPHIADVDTRRNFTYVPQGNSLLSGTIRQNMLLVNEQATDEQIIEALKVSAAEFVLDLPDGLDTICGESGTGLSEGQCQRIAIARALIHRGGIMILDEATSALDTETEERLLNNIHTHLAGTKTIVFISHRPAAIRIADDVVNLSES
ncbi:MAG: ABC transporter ATP-binding protein [Bacteroidales bacterium]|nr:ABC transporter ATP-binding protein [Bacteroidales bacterium]